MIQNFKQPLGENSTAEPRADKVKPSMVKFIILLLSTSFLAPSLAAETPRIAIFDASRAFNAFPLTKEKKQEINDRKKKVESTPSMQRLRFLQDELNSLTKDIELLEPGSPEAIAKTNKFKTLGEEWKEIQKRLSSFLQQESKNIDRLMVNNTLSLLTIISETAHAVGKEKGVDLVFETSGVTNSQVPQILYIEEKIDITDEVIAKLQAYTPPIPPEEVTISSEKPSHNKKPLPHSQPLITE